MPKRGNKRIKTTKSLFDCVCKSLISSEASLSSITEALLKMPHLKNDLYSRLSKYGFVINADDLLTPFKLENYRK
jgi:hypothetical protein